MKTSVQRYASFKLSKQIYATFTIVLHDIAMFMQQSINSCNTQIEALH